MHSDLLVVFVVKDLQFLLERVLVVHLIIGMIVRLSCALIIAFIVVKRTLLLGFDLLLQHVLIGDVVLVAICCRNDIG